MKFNVVFSSLFLLSFFAAALPNPVANGGLAVRSEGGLAAAERSVDTVAKTREYVERDGILEGSATYLLRALESLTDQLIEAAKQGGQVSAEVLKTVDSLVTTLADLGVELPQGLLDKIKELKDLLENP